MNSKIGKLVGSMKKYKYLVKATFKSAPSKERYNIKDPNLKELYEFATGKEIEHQHDSSYDTFHLWKSIKAIEMDI